MKIVSHADRHIIVLLISRKNRLLAELHTAGHGQKSLFPAKQFRLDLRFQFCPLVDARFCAGCHGQRLFPLFQHMVAAHDLTRPAGQMLSHLLQHTGIHIVVAVYEHEMAAAGLLHPRHAGRRRPAVLTVYDPHSVILCGILVAQSPAAVRGIIVHQHKLQISVCLPENAVDARSQVFLFIINRYDHADSVLTVHFRSHHPALPGMLPFRGSSLLLHAGIPAKSGILPLIRR